MADYFTNMSQAIRVPKEAAEWFIDIANSVNIEDVETPEEFTRDTWNAFVVSIDGWLGVEAHIEETSNGTVLFIHDDAGTVNIEAVAIILQMMLAKFDLTGTIGFEWANGCSKLRPDAFGGGAVAITSEEMEFFSTSQWLREQTTTTAEAAA